MKKIQQILTLVLSLGFIAVFAAWFWILPDADESTVERRHLAKCPALSLSSVANGSFMSGFEKYMLDQFPLRGGFRTLKAAANAGVFMQKDNNGLYSVGEHLSKLDFPTDFGSVNRAAQRFRYVYDAYLKSPGVKTPSSRRKTAIPTRITKHLSSVCEADFRKRNILTFQLFFQPTISITPIRTGGRRRF